MIIIKRVFKWIILSIVLQLLVLSYFNFIYFPGIGGVIKTTKLGETGVLSPTPQGYVFKTTKMNIPSNASQIKLSYNSLYGGYIVDGKLTIVDVNTGAVLKVFEQENKKVTFFKWLYDRNLVLYSYASTDYSGRIQMLSYDAGTEMDHSYPEEYMPPLSEIVDIELSPLTNVFYTKVKTSDTRSRIYKYNIMNDFSLIMRTDLGVRISEAKYSDNLIYQDSSDVIQVRNGMDNTTNTIGLNFNAVLLEIDSEDNIYAGQLNASGKVEKIFYGKLGEKIDSWKNVSLDNPVLPDDIKVTPSGKIYVANSNSNLVLNVLDGKQIDLKGKYIEVLDGDIAINNNGKLVLLVYQK